MSICTKAALLLASAAIAALLGVSGCAGSEPAPGGDSAGLAVPNDNRTPAGTLRDGVLELNLEARLVRWKGEPSLLSPDVSDPTVVTVLAFGEEGGPVTIPGPLIRVPEGTEVRVRVRNSIPESVSIGLPGPALREEGMSSHAGPELVVRGLTAGTAPDDILRVPRGEVREIRYRADKPGTYFYWATPSDRAIRIWTGRDAQLAGAIIVDPKGIAPDPDERIFVITMIDMFPAESSASPEDDVFRRAINGRSWPDTERFHYTVGQPVRWRWINASAENHPMHLHGFHFRLLSRGNGSSETLLPDQEQPLIVTERMSPGSTFRMEWIPTRPGNWLFHCHILDHIVPAVERDEAARAHDLHDVRKHALEAMAGLVIGMTVSDEGGQAAKDGTRQKLRLVALEKPLDDGKTQRGFAVEDETGPPVKAPAATAPPLVLKRGEGSEITVVNRLTEPTTIHWHGMELESFYDGVAGWSGADSRLAPLILPGDSFAVRMTPPRAGTFIYHTHMDETEQLVQGMAGPLLVLEPDQTFDPTLDRIFTIGGESDGDYPVNINGHTEPLPASFDAGTEYRLRFIQITQGVSTDITLSKNGVPLRWRAAAKDGAELPAALQVESDATLRANAGETFDFLWTPREAGEAVLLVRYDQFLSKREVDLRQVFRIR